MREPEIEEELRLEKLRDLQSKRRAREQSEAFSLVERAASLLVAVVGAVYTLAHYPQAPPIPAVACALGGSVALILRRRH
jgi:hypothetical protein